ncbi:MAG TPA: Maf family protein [Smithella sp.]|nr:Maf family protein [Smithella sp.]
MSGLFNDSFILASASPRRKELLRLAGLQFKTIPADVDEDWRRGESPRKHVKRLSLAKAMVVAQKYPRAWVLGADTIVVIDGKILGKPAGKIQAEKMLKQLSGREHQVLTGFAVVHRASELVRTKVVQSWVRFKDVTPEEMAWYVHSDEPYDKAGGYAAQGKGAYFIRSIRGSFTNVIGLPLCETLEVLTHLGLIHFG